MFRQLGVVTLLAAACATSSWAAVVHRYTFNDGTANDSVGTAHGTLMGAASIVDGSVILNGGTDHVDLGGPAIQINTFTSGFSLELWAKSSPANTNYTMGAVLGRTYDPTLGEPDWAGYQYIMMQPTRGAGPAASRVAITNGRFEQERGINGPGQINDNLLHQIVATVSPTTLSYYVDGALIGSTTMDTTTISGLSNNLAYLGRSVYQFDPNFVGSIDQFSIYNTALTGAEVLANYNTGPVGTGSPGAPKLVIDRVTGAMSLQKQGAPLDVYGYTINAPNGALDATKWRSIANNYDQDSGGSFDNNDVWFEMTASDTSLSEEELVDGGGDDGGKLGVGAGATANLQIMNAGGWRRTYRENDVSVTLKVLVNGSPTQTNALVEFTGNGGNPWKRSDFNFDNLINAADYNILLANHLKPLTETTAATSYAKGDINGDLANNVLDFRLFKADYIAANGEAAFYALVGGVPEPASAALVAVVLPLLRRRRR